MKLNNKTKTILAMSIVLVAFTILTIFSAYPNNNVSQSTPAITAATTTPVSITPIPEYPTNSLHVTNSTSSITITPASTPMPTQTVLVPSVGDRNAIGEITIRTDRKTRTYDIMGNVNKDILKRNIGYLPGSALPGQSGTCILMGHRDTDFSILKYSKTGDTIMVKYNNTVYTYCVKYIEIIESNDDLKFGALDGSYLVLVTCYPFRYTGRAPQKFVVVCVLDI